MEQSSQCHNLFSFFGAQDIAHADGDYSVAVNAPGLIVGRFWVTAEAEGAI